MSYFDILILLLAAFLTFALVFVLFCPEQFDPYQTDQAAIVEDALLRKRNEDGPVRDKTAEQVKAELEQEQTPRHGRERYPSSVQIVVLGDIGRSPRMQYHAISLIEHGAYVDIVGYIESELHPALRDSHLVHTSKLPPTPALLQTKSRALFPLVAPLKAIWQTLTLVYALAYATRPCKWMLVQNPPAIPVLAVARLVSWLRNTRLIVDWHNFGWSILALKLGRSHPLVRISEVYEKALARTADNHFTVTAAMAKYLKTSMSVTALPLHDRPAADFQPIAPAKRAYFYRQLEPLREHGKELSSGAMRLLVSSTSWTPDEDFSVLLDALVEYCAAPKVPRVLVVITGKGPQKEGYVRRIKELTVQGRLSRAVVKTAFLSFEDYAALLGVADLGISLHTSSSGLDLPMKVVDMFGAGLPVAGWDDYEAWPELVTEGLDGRGFRSAGGLAALLVELLATSRESLAKLREGALAQSERRWRDEWDSTAGARVFFPELGRKTK